MKKLYEIEDFENKKVCCKGENYKYFKLEDEKWVNENVYNCDDFVGRFFYKPFWYEYEEPKEKTREYFHVIDLGNKMSIDGVYNDYESARKAIDNHESGSYEIRKVYMR